MTKRWSSAAICLLGAVMLVGAMGCSGQTLTTREKGTLLGGGLGAAGGAIIGAAAGAPGAGAAIGGVLGAGSGFLVGNALQNNEIRESYTDGRLVYQQREIEQQRREISQLRQEHESE
jgi:osmotically inducible lipoprotein OsmB